jgi:Protein of unknown function (DUF2628)
MAVYTVHQPPSARQTAPDPERFAFVRDGFSFAAFLFGPLWMLRHRMWLVLLGYVVIVGGLQFGLHRIDASLGVRLTVGLLVALLIGFEAGTLRRFTLARRRWTNVGVVVGDDRELAERRFFDAWVRSEAPAASATAAGSGLRMAPSSPEVIGLFPESGAPR